MSRERIFKADDRPKGKGKSERKGHSYTVGYAKPPRHTQFKQGQSGNPKGRGKGRPNVGQSIKRVLMSKVQITIGRKTITVPRYEAIMWKQMENAIKGNARSAEWLIRFANDEAPELKFDHAIDIKQLSEQQLEDLAERLQKWVDENPDDA